MQLSIFRRTGEIRPFLIVKVAGFRKSRSNTFNANHFMYLLSQDVNMLSPVRLIKV